jgi:hypothetical protein
MLDSSPAFPFISATLKGLENPPIGVIVGWDAFVLVAQPPFFFNAIDRAIF